jgi:small subunit ribosomal protein S16
MLKIRLKKTGCKHKPFYRIVLMKNLSKRDGKPIDDIGFYNPIQKLISINKIKLYKYINIGAYPTNTVRHLIKRLLFL